MARLERRLTDSLARKIEPPSAGYEIHWCADDSGMGLRVTAAGSRAWIMERRVEGKTVRRTLGKATGSGAISVDAARRLKLKISGELQEGHDRAQIKREQAQIARQETITFAEALRAYVKGKRRAKDGLGLKERTQADYLKMIEAPKPRKLTEGMSLPGELHAIADTPITSISASDIRALHAAAMKRGERRASYCMAVLRACLAWHGVAVADNPLGREIAGRDRIVLAPPRAKPRPIPANVLGAWWRAASNAKTESAAYYRLRLLTGVRGVEFLGDKHTPALKVGDVDLDAGTIRLRDTKNRSDHVIYLSTQAAAIIKPLIEGKSARASVFPVGDPRKTLRAINAAAGLPEDSIAGHGLRSTFATLAVQLLPAYLAKRMLNHAAGGDVTQAHYFEPGADVLRAGWQTVADVIETGSVEKSIGN